jgi:hypothetical protein
LARGLDVAEQQANYPVRRGCHEGSFVATALAALALGPSTSTPCLGGFAFAQGRCCMICKAGKACGDSCISRDKECHKGKGCASDG